MAIWTPPQNIRVKVLGLAWRGDELLLADVEDSDGRVTGVRPLGGSIEFGETREGALVREFREELGCDVTVVGPWHAFENLFEHEGAIGHEYLFAADITLGDPALYARDALRFLESDASDCRARWICPTRLPPGVHLYPTALLPLVRRASP